MAEIDFNFKNAKKILENSRQNDLNNQSLMITKTNNVNKNNNPLGNNASGNIPLIPELGVNLPIVNNAPNLKNIAENIANVDKYGNKLAYSAGQNIGQMIPQNGNQFLNQQLPQSSSNVANMATRNAIGGINTAGNAIVGGAVNAVNTAVPATIDAINTFGNAIVSPTQWGKAADALYNYASTPSGFNNSNITAPTPIPQKKTGVTTTAVQQVQPPVQNIAQPQEPIKNDVPNQLFQQQQQLEAKVSQGQQLSPVEQQQYDYFKELRRQSGVNLNRISDLMTTLNYGNISNKDRAGLLSQLQILTGQQNNLNAAFSGQGAREFGLTTPDYLNKIEEQKINIDRLRQLNPQILQNEMAKQNAIGVIYDSNATPEEKQQAYSTLKAITDTSTSRQPQKNFEAIKEKIATGTDQFGAPVFENVTTGILDTTTGNIIPTSINRTTPSAENNTPQQLLKSTTESMLTLRKTDPKAYQKNLASLDNNTRTFIEKAAVEQDRNKK